MAKEYCWRHLFPYFVTFFTKVRITIAVSPLMHFSYFCLSSISTADMAVLNINVSICGKRKLCFSPWTTYSNMFSNFWQLSKAKLLFRVQSQRDEARVHWELNTRAAKSGILTMAVRKVHIKKKKARPSSIIVKHRYVLFSCEVSYYANGCLF